jgi:pimeloyl-ACP methyl ester carboxylesterase
LTNLLLIHGAWCAPSIWEPLCAVLDTSVSIRVVDLPSTRDEHATLAHDAQAVHDVAWTDESFVAVAHSYGGVVLAEVGATLPHLHGALFLAALIPRTGESATAASRRVPERSRLDEAIRVRGDALVLDTDLATQALVGDLSPLEQQTWVQGLRRQSLASFRAPRTSPPWTTRGAYVLCERDDAVLPELQRRQIPAGAMMTPLDSDHCPMVSHPEALAATITDWCHRVTESAEGTLLV